MAATEHEYGCQISNNTVFLGITGDNPSSTEKFFKPPAIDKDMCDPTSIVANFILQKEPLFDELRRFRQEGSSICSVSFSLTIFKGWENPDATAYFSRQKVRADTADSTNGHYFYQMMQNIGHELQRSTNILTPSIQGIEALHVLDICMAPGGFTKAVLDINPNAKAHGISLPEDLGGHKLRLPADLALVVYLDVTMLLEEYSDHPIPPIYPDPHRFSSARPFLGQKFDLVLCDGQVLRTHEQYRQVYRESHEKIRLKYSQLILALQRIKNGGTMILLLHELDDWANVELFYQMSRFSKVMVWKSKKSHCIRSSFYLIAKDVDANCQFARDTLLKWKEIWWQVTFGGINGTGEGSFNVEESYVQEVLNQVGDDLIRMGRPVWNIQRRALQRPPWRKVRNQSQRLMQREVQ